MKILPCFFLLSFFQWGIGRDINGCASGGDEKKGL